MALLMIMKLLPFYCLARAFPTQVTIELDAGMKRLGYLLDVVLVANDITCDETVP